MSEDPPHTKRQGWAWVGLCLALAVHVADEALTDFLSIYLLRATRRSNLHRS